MNRYEQDLQRVKAEEKAFRDKYQREDGMFVNVPYPNSKLGRYDKLASKDYLSFDEQKEFAQLKQATAGERLQYVIENDPRTPREGEMHEETALRRKEAALAELQQIEIDKAKYAYRDEKKVFDHLESMGLGRTYQESVPRWVQQMREENEE